ncbi:hypothetical protein [Adhaeribacter aquaticus]|uniref:hypothetical protein n=1 Tax=Adhaeribacter aquaticus TaxID=299567 RepID=UPI00040B380B|nr:hypothetical protein [Adhaeribacter aquaticus]
MKKFQTTGNKLGEIANQDFNFIIERIFKTIEAYSARFAELNPLHTKIELLLEIQKDLTPVTKLENICGLLKEAAVDSYIIRKLHVEACKDLEALKGNELLDNQQIIYWNS